MPSDLTPYSQAVLTAELSGPDYAGLSADDAWAWLMADRPVEYVETPSGFKLTPASLARLVGVAKAQAVAVALRAAYPDIAPYLMEAGVDPLAAESGEFLGQLVTGGVLTADDVSAIRAATVTRTEVLRPARRFDERFYPARWPSVTAAGAVDPTGASPAISGFPNTITRADFDAAWAAAGRG